MLALLTSSGSQAFDLIIIVKDGIEQSGLRGKEVVPVSLNPYAIIIDVNQERVERRREEKGGCLVLPIHTQWQETGHQKGATHKRTRVLKLLVGYHDLGALNELRHP